MRYILWALQRAVFVRLKFSILQNIFLILTITLFPGAGRKRGGGGAEAPGESWPQPGLGREDGLRPGA